MRLGWRAAPSVKTVQSECGISVMAKHLKEKLRQIYLGALEAVDGTHKAEALKSGKFRLRC